MKGSLFRRKPVETHTDRDTRLNKSVFTLSAELLCHLSETSRTYIGCWPSFSRPAARYPLLTHQFCFLLRRSLHHANSGRGKETVREESVWVSEWATGAGKDWKTSALFNLETSDRHIVRENETVGRKEGAEREIVPRLTFFKWSKKEHVLLHRRRLKAWGARFSTLGTRSWDLIQKRVQVIRLWTGPD